MNTVSMEQNSSVKLWWIVGAIAILAVAGWYFYPKQAAAPGPQASSGEPPQAATVGSGDTVADISADLAATPDDSAALNAAAAASAADVQGF